MTQWVKLLIGMYAFLVLVCVSATLHLILAHGLGKAVENVPNIWAPVTHVGDLSELLAPAFNLAQTWLLWPWESGPVVG